MALTSFYGNLLLQLQTHLQTAVPELKWIDQDFGQLELDVERPPVQFPCALIDFNGSQFSQELMNIELAENCLIQVRVGFAPFSSTNFLTPVEFQEKALQYYEIENKVYRALKGWYGVMNDGTNDYAICQPLNRVSDLAEKNRNDSLRVRALLFSTSYEDDTANITLESATPDLKVTYNNDDAED